MAGDSDGGFVPALWTLGPDQKLGLALSGGGFRASLFHIGVLARMAELDLLRHVGVLSTVSGGSIIGALLSEGQTASRRRQEGRARRRRRPFA